MKIDKKNLSPTEVVRRFFEEDDFRSYVSRIFKEPGLAGEVRQYAEAAGGPAELPLERLVDIETSRPNPIVRGLLEEALDQWVESLAEDGFGPPGPYGYFEELAAALSSSKMRDPEIMRKMRSDRHLAQVINYANKSLADPAKAEKWLQGFPLSFAEPEVAKLFLYFGLERELHGRPVIGCLEQYELGDDLLGCLARGGFVFMRKVNPKYLPLVEAMTHTLTFHNVLALIIRQGYYLDWAGNPDWADALKLYLLTNSRPELLRFLKEGDQELRQAAVAAWTELLEDRPYAVANQAIGDRMPSAQEFLRGLPDALFHADPEPWRNLKRLAAAD